MIINEPLIRITDFNDPRLDIYTRLPEVQLLRYREPKPGIFLAESPKVIERALLAQCPDVPVYVASAGLLAQMRGFQMTRGMLCAMNRRVLPSVESVCERASRVAVLEDVVNPTNVGAIMRSLSGSLEGVRR